MDMSGADIAGLLVTPATITAAVAYLLTALGLSSSAGLRAYLPLLVLGIASHITAPSGQPYLQLQPDLQALGSPPVLVLLGVLVLVEFAVDKVPALDHASDLVHTILRPAAGALVFAGVQNPVSDHSQLAAAIVGGALALGVHGLKASTRAGVSATTVGLGNPVVSLIEDVLVVAVTILAVVAPLVGFLLMVAVLFVVWRVLRRLVRALFGRSRGAPQAQMRASVLAALPVAAVGAPSQAPRLVPPVPATQPRAAPYVPPQPPAQPTPRHAPVIPPILPPGGLPPLEETRPLPPSGNTWPPVSLTAPTIPGISLPPSSSAPTWPGWPPAQP